jgi:hypothetical protein
VRRRCPTPVDRAGRPGRRGVELRAEDLYKPPGVAETIDWTEALVALGATTSTPTSPPATLGRCSSTARTRSGPGPGHRRSWSSAPSPAGGRGGRAPTPLDTSSGSPARCAPPASTRTPGRVQALVEALAVLDPTAPTTSTGPGGPACAPDHDDVERYDRVFDAYFGGEAPHERLRAVAPPRTSSMRQSLAAPLPEQGADDDARSRCGAATRPRRGAPPPGLRRHGRPAERGRWSTGCSPPAPAGRARRTRRHQPGPRRRAGPPADPARGAAPGRRARAGSATGGARSAPPGRAVVDVSGSMATYADRAAALRPRRVGCGRGTPTEVFTSAPA